MKRILVIWLALVALVAPAFPAGLILIHDPGFWIEPPTWPPRPPAPRPPLPRPPAPSPPSRPWSMPVAPSWAALEVAFVQVNTKIKDQVAVTKIEEEFYNPNPRQVEGTFLFPVPKGAQINQFTMEINGRQVAAELLAADKARGIYEDIVRKLRDPALLEYSGRDLFKVRIFPIEPNSKKRITLSYTQILKADDGVVGFALPLNTEKYSAKPLKTVSIKVDIEGQRALKSIYSPSHKVEIKNVGERHAVVGFEGGNLKPDADFQLYYTQDDGNLGVSLITHTPPGEDGYFLLMASPGAENKKTKTLPKDVVFVIDTSGSMAGSKLEQAKKALLFCVENLNDVDRFEIIRFSTEVEPLFDHLTATDAPSRQRAREFIHGLKPIGGTAIDDALKKALTGKPEVDDRPYVVIFLTDGRPTIGTTDEDQILKNALQNRKGTTRVFCFGIGTDVNTHLLDLITEETHAFSQYVLPDEDLEVKVSGFYTKIKDPALANTKLQFTGDLRATKIYPAPLPDLFKGDQLIVVGRFTGQGDSAAIIEGTVNGEARKFSFDVKFDRATEAYDFIPRLWATRRVGYLLDEIRLRGENQELKEEVTELARKYGIVTPYTAYLIVEDEARRGVAQNAQSLRVLTEDPQARRDLSLAYGRASRDRAGAGAVGGARSYSSLKSAQSSSEAINLGTQDAFQAAPAMAQPMVSGPSRAGGSFTYAAPADSKPESVARQFTQQGQYIAGRTFYFNEGQWVDAGVQKAQAARRIQMQLGSPEYFALLKKHPEATPWLALGSNLQVCLDGAVYEIHE